MNKLEEAMRQSDETRWAVIGRAIADGQDRAKWMQEAAILRRQEQDSADKQTQFAAIARQIGDAIRVGRETDALLDAICKLRRQELG